MSIDRSGKHRRILGIDRDRLRDEVAVQYGRGASIRDLAAEHERSYGFIHRLLCESGIPRRPPGGSRKQLRTEGAV